MAGWTRRGRPHPDAGAVQYCLAGGVYVQVIGGARWGAPPFSETAANAGQQQKGHTPKHVTL